MLRIAASLAKKAADPVLIYFLYTSYILLVFEVAYRIMI